MHSSAQDSVPTARRQRMRRPTHSCLLVAALILAAWQSAHASSQLDVPTDAGAAAKGSPQAPVPAPGHGTAEANLLFVQQAGSAELIFDSPDTATDQARLVLHNVAPSTTWFTDKPIRRAGAFETAYFASSETFASDGVWLGAPNAALTGTDDAGQPYVVVLTLYSPVYSNQGHTLEYQASLMINETDRSLRLAGGAVHFQAKHAVEDLGALAFVSSGQDVFRLKNAALFIDDYLGAYPNGICLSSFVSCPNYYGFYNRGYWGGWGGYGPGFSNYIGIRRLCPKCWEKKGADDSSNDGVPSAAAPDQGSPSPSGYSSPSPSPSWSSPSPSPSDSWSSPSPSPSSGSPSPADGSWHCTGCSTKYGKYSCDECKWW